MGARPWLLESRTHTMDQLCVYYVICLQLLFPPAYGAVKFIDFGFPSYYHCNDVWWHCRHECISDDNEWEICFMRTWEITQILQFTVLTNVDVNGSQIGKVYCYWTMKCWNVFLLSLFCLVREMSDGIHKPCYYVG